MAKQQASEFLASALQQRGARAVAYPEQSKPIIAEHLVELNKVFPELRLDVSEFHSNDGRTSNLLQARGTIPIHYQGNKYNIPVCIWVPEGYPHQAPIAFVEPTPNMVIRPGHQCVNSSGEVATRTLRGWRYPSSNLVESTLDMSHTFSTDPPLYSKPGTNPPQQASTSAAASGARYGQPPGQPPPPPMYSSPASSSGSVAPTVQPPAGYPSYSGFMSGQPPPPPPPPGGPPPPPPGAGGSGMYGPGMYSSFPLSSSGQGYSMPQGSGPGPYGPPPPPPPPGPGPAPAAGPMGGSSSFGPPPPGQGMPASGQAGGQPGSQQPLPLWGAVLAAVGNQGSGMRPPPPPPPPPAEPPKPRKEDLEAGFRRLAVTALAKQLAAAEKALTAHCVRDTNAQLELQRVLLDRKQQLSATVESLKRERKGAEAAVQDMSSKSHQLRTWLDRNEAKAVALGLVPSLSASAANGVDGQPEAEAGPNGAQAGAAAAGAASRLDVGKALLPVDELARQALEAHAQDQAIEDTILQLDKALQSGLSSLTLDQYLKQVRTLSRKQFFHRMTAQKAGEAQQQRAQLPMQPPMTHPSAMRYSQPPVDDLSAGFAGLRTSSHGMAARAYN